MTKFLSPSEAASSIPVDTVSPAQFDALHATLEPFGQRWLESTQFEATANAFSLLPDAEGRLARVIAIVDPDAGAWGIAGLPMALPAGDYHLVRTPANDDEEQAEATAAQSALGIGWALAQYRFVQFKGGVPDAKIRRLALHADAFATAASIVDATVLVRDLVNTPAESLSPLALSDVCREVAEQFDAQVAVTVGDDLLIERFPAVHVVGRASSRPSCLIDMHWGDEADPQIVLVGKGVCFDTGGLDLKAPAGMRLMKKDMGGAAHALALGQLVMQAKLPVNLRVLIPAVENAVAGNAYRPGDVIPTRAGINVEIDNTDAEGRIILSDALTAAAESSPALIIDFATLTGAARIALGTDVPAMFCNDDGVAQALATASAGSRDPMWRMPLYPGYLELLDSDVGDIANTPGSQLGGAITAALFLERFVTPRVPWVHFDLMAWNNRDRPGRPKGGEAMGLRALFDYLRHRFVSSTSEPER